MKAILMMVLGAGSFSILTALILRTVTGADRIINLPSQMVGRFALFFKFLILVSLIALFALCLQYTADDARMRSSFEASRTMVVK